MNLENPQLRNAGTNQTGMRQYNERRILAIIRETRGITKADIAKATNLTPQTATIIINRLEEQDLLLAGEKRRGGKGQPSTPYRLNPDGALSIGIKIGRSSLEVLLVGFTGEVRSRLSYNYAFPEPKEVFYHIKRSLDHILGSLTAEQHAKVLGIGVAAPYSMDGWAGELKGPIEARKSWANINIRAEIAALTTIPTTLTNDATAACIAELTFGNPHKWQSFLYFYVGTFIGGGLVLNNQIYAGHNTNAGAMGSIPLSSSKQLIADASLYHLDQELSQLGLAKIFLEGASEINPETWLVYTRWADKAALAIAYAIASGCAFVDPEGMIIDGRIPAKATTYLVDAIRHACHTDNWEGLSKPTIICGNIGFDARALGGALLPIYSTFAPDSDAYLKATS
jgi:predicted NBD/HSP70 family sugar kinase